MLSQLTHIKSDPLDVLLFAVGLRLTQLAKTGDDKFKSLLDNRNFTIQLGSEAEGTARHYQVSQGKFSQHAGAATEPTLTITFKDSMTGVKLLTKGEATAFMTGIQNGDLKMSGDYSLLMWFNQVAKYIVPKVPEPLKPVVEQAKPLLERAAPFAKDLCAKAMAIFGGATAPTATGNSKYFKDADTTADEASHDTADKQHTESKIDALKDKVADIRADVTDKLDALKTEATDKLDTLKEDARDKLDEVKQAGQEQLDSARAKLDDLKEHAEEKLQDAEQLAAEKLDSAKEKVVSLKHQADDKLDALNEEAKEKISNAKDKVTADVTDADSKTDSDIRPDNVFAKSVENKDNLTPAMKKSAEIEAKHADEAVIADNVRTSAVEDERSPITNISVTRGDNHPSK